MPHYHQSEIEADAANRVEKRLNAFYTSLLQSRGKRADKMLGWLGRPPFFVKDIHAFHAGNPNPKAEWRSIGKVISELLA